MAAAPVETAAPVQEPENRKPSLGDIGNIEGVRLWPEETTKVQLGSLDNLDDDDFVLWRRCLPDPMGSVLPHVVMEAESPVKTSLHLLLTSLQIKQ